MGLIKITIEEEGKETQVFETRGFLGAIIGQDRPNGGSDTTQILSTDGITEKDLIKLIAGNLNTVYRVADDIGEATEYIGIAAKVALKGYLNDRHATGAN